MPASTTALTVVAPSGAGGLIRDVNEQSSDVSPGNNFINDGKTYLFARNTTASAIDLTFEAHINDVERTVLTATVPGSGTDNGELIVGPFDPALFNVHGAVDTDRAYVRQASGSDGEVKLMPFRTPHANG